MNFCFSQEPAGSSDGENSINAWVVINVECGAFCVIFFNPMGLVQHLMTFIEFEFFLNQLIKEVFLRNRMGMRTIIE
jgi:hypothetical protein